jgi:hypothetical protein
MSTWSLCLTSRQGRKVVKLASTATTKELYELAGQALGDTDTDTDTDASSIIVSLKFGFPPKSMANDETCISSILQNQERIQVELGTATTKDADSSKKKAAKSVASASTSTTRPKSKRAAAQKAIEAMPAMIKAQEQLMRQQKSSPAKKRPRTTTTNNPTAKRKPPPPRFAASVGEGRRLADGVAVASAPPKKKPRTTRKTRGGNNPLQAPPSDMSEALMGALDNKGKMGLVLRKGMKNAVQASYETTRAFSRLAAVQGKNFELEVKGNSLCISYKGSVDKTKVEEQVDCIPLDVLEAVIQGIYASNQEALRPENLAQLSPRVMWSCVHYFPNLSNISEMYQELLPTLEWTFLRRRAPQLSEKALENLRQDQVASGQGPNVEQASQAIAAVEHAMEHLQDYEATERKAKQAQAALQRLQGHASPTTAEWQLETPTEPDRDELRDCIQQTDDYDMTSLITKLMKECHIHNWRELANWTDIAGLAKKLRIPLDAVQQWVDRAQDESVGEIVVEICDNNVPAVELLTEKARTATPKDLANWRCIPEMLCDQVGKNDVAVTVDRLSVWCQRAHQALQDYEWLNWYATPVE